MNDVNDEIRSCETINLTDKGNQIVHKRKNKFTWKNPPDGGYSWVILIAGFILTMLVGTSGNLFSLVFLHKIKALNMTTLSIAWTYNFKAFVWSVAGAMSGPLCEEFGWRKVGMASSFICAVSIFASCFASSIVEISLYFSVLNGFGGGLAFSTCIYVVSNYFLKLRGRALALNGIGFGVGQLIFPLIIRYLQVHYGFQGAAFIFSAILLHGILAAALFHPVELHQEKFNRNNTSENNKDKSLNDFPNIYQFNDNNITIFHSIWMRLHNFIKVFKKIFVLTYFNIVNLRSPVVAIIALSEACKIVSFLNIMLMLPLSFVSKGLSLQEAAYCISVTGIFMITFRIIAPSLSDFKILNATFSLAISRLLIAVSCFVFTFLSTFSHIVICIGFFGAGVGASFGLQPIILIDYKGLKDLPQTYGSIGVVNAVLFIVIGTSFGYVRDVTGSYILMYRMCSGVLFFSAVVWLFMPCALSYEKKKHQHIENNAH